MKKSIALIDDLIQMEEAREREYKALCHKTGQSQKSIGESAMLFHLKTLRELVEFESKENPQLRNRDFHGT